MCCSILLIHLSKSFVPFHRVQCNFNVVILVLVFSPVLHLKLSRSHVGWHSIFMALVLYQFVFSVLLFILTWRLVDHLSPCPSNIISVMKKFKMSVLAHHILDLTSNRFIRGYELHLVTILCCKLSV